MEVILVMHTFLSLVLLAVTLVGMVGNCFGVAHLPRKISDFLARVVKQFSGLEALGARK